MQRMYLLVMVLLAFLCLNGSLSALEVTIGDGSEQALIPVNMYYRTSLFETIYIANEMNVGGLITAIRFYSNFTDNLLDKPVNIWLGETLSTDLSAGWIPSHHLDPVFSGTANFYAGAGTVTITLSTPFMYHGGNLIMMVQRPWDDDYYLPMNYFAAQTVGTNRSLSTFNHNFPIDPEIPPVTGTTGQFPKTTFFVTVQGMGSLSGTVTSGGAPLQDALVIVSSTTQSFTTGADGSFSFPYIAAGTQTVSVSKLGYGNVSHTVNIIENQPSVQDYTLPLLSLVTLSGRVVGSDAPALGIAGAEISLDGYAPFSGSTDGSGNFNIMNVYSDQTYSYSISAAGYQTGFGQVAVGAGNQNMGDIILSEIAYAPLNVSAIESPDGTEVNVLWEAPITAESGWLHYDSGENYTSFGTGGSLSFDVAIRYPAGSLTDYAGGSLQALRIWPATGGNFALRVWTGGNASAPATMVVNQPIIPVLNTWNTILLNDPVLITDTEELWFGFLCDVTGVNPAYAGIDAGPAVNGFGNMIYWQGNWTTLLAVNAYCDFNWNIQGYAGMDPPDARRALNAPEIGLGTWNMGSDDFRDFTGYKVWRLASGMESNENMWISLTDTAITPTSFTDAGWDDVPGGDYKWAVKAVYSNEVLSFPVFSNQISKISLIGTLAGTVRTAQNAPIAGATISAGTETATTNSNGNYSILLPEGSYSVTCAADGYHDNVQTNVVVIAGQTTTLSFIMATVSNSDDLTIALTELRDNFPNPFSRQTILSYEVKEPMPVRISIYNLKGQLVRVLVDELKSGGSHSIMWDGTDASGKAVASGIYQSRMQAGDYRSSRRMLFLRD